MGSQSITGKLESLTGCIEETKETAEKLDGELKGFEKKLSVLSSSLENFDREIRAVLENEKIDLEQERDEVLEQRERAQEKVDTINKEFRSCTEQYNNELAELREIMRMQEGDSEIYQTMMNRYEQLRTCQEKLLELKDLGFKVDEGNKLERPECIEDVKCEKLADEIHESAIEREPELTGAVEECASRLGGRPVGLEARLKEPDSIARKMKTYTHHGTSPERAKKQINDANRYTVTFENDSFTDSFFKAKAMLEAQGYEMLTCKNTLKLTGVEYRGVNCMMRGKDGSIWELQFHTAQSYEVKEFGTHGYYEEARAETTSEKRKKELSDIMTKLADKIIAPAGIERIADFRIPVGRKRKS